MAEPLREAVGPQEFYASLEPHGPLEHMFQNIDERANFREYMTRLQDPKTSNFVLDFGNEDAFCATDLTKDYFKTLFTKPRPQCFGTRWINIWAPEEQKETIKLITSLYGVSERLQGLMCTEPVTRRPRKPAQSKKQQSQTNQVDPSLRGQLDDLESAIALEKIAKTDSSHDASSLSRLTFAQVTDQIWHFSSVDYGTRYTCLGYNTLFVAPDAGSQMNENGKDLPEGTRVWTWLILCDDGTVISIQENPFPKQHALDDSQKEVVNVVRRNIRFIVSGVSKEHANTSESESLVTIRVRHFHGAEQDQASIQQEDGPSLIFYYVFDDWVSSYGLIAKRQHQYGVSLENLRSSMLDRPVVDLVNELHWLGRRLAVLKRVYQSYEFIMRRILQRQRVLRDEAQARSAHRPPMSLGSTFHETDFAEYGNGRLMTNGHFGATDKAVGVVLSSSAITRFERLVDRINLYCLSEIDSCLLEKESLTFLNFNLIALKDSQAVEKLTRITILLAKATMMFLPVSLMTAYFSTELIGVKGGYTKVDYWASFAVIFVLTILLLIVFGFASDTVEGKTIYRSLVKTFFRNSRQRILGRPMSSGRSE